MEKVFSVNFNVLRCHCLICFFPQIIVFFLWEGGGENKKMYKVFRKSRQNQGIYCLFMCLDSKHSDIVRRKNEYLKTFHLKVVLLIPSIEAGVIFLPFFLNF